jgi:hypothetical protein
MPMLMLDCGRCGAQEMTHDVRAATSYYEAGHCYEYTVQCRACFKSSVWQVGKMGGHPDPTDLLQHNYTINKIVHVIALAKPRATALPAPEYTPPELKLIFDEGAQCLAIGAWNASSAMFRKIVDQISKDKMNAAPNPPPDNRTRFNLKPRLKWLFDNNLLPKEVESLADSIREDANDGVHNVPLGEADALDVQDFTVELLETLYTLPGRLREAEARRAQRRTAPGTG